MFFVEYNDGERDHIIGVYSTKEVAEAAIDRFREVWPIAREIIHVVERHFGDWLW